MEDSFTENAAQKGQPSGDPAGQGRPARTAAIFSGVFRLCAELGLTPISEVTFKTGLRADIVALSDRGAVHVFEVKSSREDFESDQKWQGYLEWCDHFYFAVDADFPDELLPTEHGLVIGDAYGAAIVREAPEDKLAPARRKALTLLIARKAAERLVLMEQGFR